MNASINHSFGAAVSHLHGAFLAVLPRIERQARVFFADVRCPHRREDVVAETLALTWRWYVLLLQRGKNPNEFISVLGGFAARRVRAGRCLCGKEKVNDALSALAQRRRGFVVAPLPDSSSHDGNIFDEALRDNTQTEVGDQVAFRVDFPVWRSRRCDRDRRLIDDLLVGERTLDVASKYGLSPGRVSQLRREFYQDWLRFHGEDEASVARREDIC